MAFDGGRIFSRRLFLASGFGIAATPALAAIDRSTGITETNDDFNASYLAAAQLAVNNIAHEGLDDVFARPFEVEMLKKSPALRDYVAKEVSTLMAREACGTGAALHLMDFPKHVYGARRSCVLVEPMEAAAYLALAIMVAQFTEVGRISPQENRIFSYRFLPRRAALFDRRYSFTAFHRARARQSKDYPVTIRTDIENCYGSISVAMMQRALDGEGVPAAITNRIVTLLERWQESSTLKGLPVGSHGSRILAEAVFAPIDRALLADNIPFIRFVDDYALAADDPDHAEHRLDRLSGILDAHGLRLNVAKTEIFAQTGGPVCIPRAGVHCAGQEIGHPLPRATCIPRPGVHCPDETEGDGGSAYPHIPKKPKAPSASEIDRLKLLPPPEMGLLLDGPLRTPREVRHLIRRAVHGAPSPALRLLPDVLNRYPEFSTYIVRSLIHAGGTLGATDRADLADRFSMILAARQSPPFVEINLVMLLSNRHFVRRDTILAFVRDHAATLDAMVLRQALDRLRKTGGIPADIAAPLLTGDDRWIIRSIVADGTAVAEAPERLVAMADGDPFLRLLLRQRLA